MRIYRYYSQPVLYDNFQLSVFFCIKPAFLTFLGFLLRKPVGDPQRFAVLPVNVLSLAQAVQYHFLPSRYLTALKAFLHKKYILARYKLWRLPMLTGLQNKLP